MANGNLRIHPPIHVFYGRVTQNSAHVYAQVSSLAAGAEWTLNGTVRGPHCQFSHTLPASFHFRDAGGGPTLLAEAVVSEPCFWSPRLPSLYDVSVELCGQDGVLQKLERSIGFRALGDRGDSLFLEGSRWVLRGIQSTHVHETSLADWHAASAAVVVADPSIEHCRAASEQGVLIVAKLVSGEEICRQLTRLSGWAAVAVAVLPPDTDPPEDIRHAAPNLLLAQWQTSPQTIRPAPWAQMIFCEVSDPGQFHKLVEQCPLPIVAVRGLNEIQSLSAARRGCDRLQRDLAPLADCAGYVV